MAVATITIDDILAELKKRSVADQLFIIAKLSSGLSGALGNAENSLTNSDYDTVDTPSVATVNDVSHRYFTSDKVSAIGEMDEPVSETRIDNIDALFGAWEGVDDGWSQPLEVVVKSDRLSSGEPPKF